MGVCLWVVLWRLMQVGRETEAYGRESRRWERGGKARGKGENVVERGRMRWDALDDVLEAQDFVKRRKRKARAMRDRISVSRLGLQP